MKRLINRFLIPAASFALLLALIGSFAISGTVQAASPVYIQTRLLSSDTVLSDQYGTSVFLNGDTAIVGADAKDGNRGAAYIFVLKETVWSQQAKITAGDAAADDHFGASVAVSGDTAIVGAYGKLDNRGAAYIFVRDGITWTQQAKLTPDDFEAGDYFGYSVSISGDTAAIGAYGKEGNTGAVYIFVRSGSTWSQQAKITANNAEAGDYFGYSVSISGDTAAIGAYGKEGNTGAVYIFVRGGDTWGQQSSFIALDSALDDHLGYAISISGDTVVAGAWKAVSLKGTTGAAYVFVRSDGVWTQQAKLTSNDPESFDRFGIAVAVDGDMAMVGADWKYGGAAYMFTRTGYKWAQQAKFTTSDAITGDRYGAAVSASNGKALVGSFAQYNNMGTAYIYSEMQPLTIETRAATSIRDTSATLNGSITSMGTATTVNLYFEYGKTNAYGTVTSTQALTDTGPFSADIINLDPDTVYHFRVRADGGAAIGVIYSQDMTFATTPVPPSIDIVSIESVQSTSATLNGDLGSLGTSSSVEVYFEYGPTTSYGNATEPQTMTDVGSFSATITGLSSNTSYHFRAVADGGAAGITYSGDRIFNTTPVTVFVEVLQASPVQANSATLNGNLTSLGIASSVDVCFEYGPTANYGRSTQTQSMVNTGAFSATITGLEPNTTYHFRIKADGGSAGIAYSEDATFTTAAVLPAVEASAATSVQTGSATLNGNLISLGTESSVRVHFEYGTTTSYGNETQAQLLAGQGEFSAALTGLTPYTIYHFRAVADVGAAAPIYSQDMTFTTASIAPSVAISSADSIKNESAVLNGEVTSMGSASAVSVYFELGTTANYGTVTTKQTVTTAGTFSIEITGLDPDTTYHFRAVVDGGEHGKTFSADSSFTTTKTSYMPFIWLAAALGVLLVAGIVIYVIRNKRGYPKIKRKPAVRPYIETISDDDLIPEEEKSANIGVYPESKPETDVNSEEPAPQAPEEEEVTPGEKVETEGEVKSDDDEKPDDNTNPHDDLPLIK
jgi:hypothetical protein